MDVLWHPAAWTELQALPPAERKALLVAREKLIAAGDRLPYPHSSAVRDAAFGLRELRPRAGRSAWRAFYRRVADALLIVAIGPEAQADPRSFRAAVAAAEARLAGILEE